MIDGHDDGLPALLDYLRKQRGLNLTGYKRLTLTRRIAKSMAAAKVDSYAAYTDHLEVHPEAFAQLFSTILINVTSFFRDPVPWDKLAAEVVPAILAAKDGGEPVRVWSAGCATGEEAYTLAMIWAEALGLDGFRDRVKIYASDVDGDGALLKARQGVYSAAEVAPLSDRQRKQYLEPAGERFAFRPDLRRSIIFGRHDLVQDAPISRLDLLVCRNTLMYFNAETQGRILARFHHAIAERGYLFLGKAEMLLTHANLFRPVDLKSRIFSKVPTIALRDRLLMLAQVGDEAASGRLAKHIRLRDETLNLLPIAQLTIDADGALFLANERARAMFGLSPQDLGRPFHDLEVSYRPLELRSLIEQAKAERGPVYVRGVERPRPAGGVQHLDVHVSLLRESDGTVLGTSVLFDDVTETHRIRGELQRSSQDLEAAYEELQSTNEELETTNEELQSTVEELQTTNEEMQSTNEEHETMNEELHSTNEELQSINRELRSRTEELDVANALLHSILSGLRTAVCVLGADANVLLWSDRAEDLWGLRAAETQGHSFMTLDIGLPTAQLIEAIRGAMAGERRPALEVAAMDRRGRSLTCPVTCTPLMAKGEAGARGVIVMMERVPT